MNTSRRLQTLFFFLFVGVVSTFAQTTVINPATDGGFENGTTFAANGWTAVNPPSNTNRNWYVGTGQSGYSGNRAAFIGNNATTVGSNAQARTVHFYKSVTIPVGATDITLSFNYKQATADYSFGTYYDYIAVYMGTTAPTNGNLPSGTQVFGPFPDVSVPAFTTQTVTIPNTFATGTAFNLIFTFNSDAATPHGYGAVDDISLTYLLTSCEAPTSPTVSNVTSNGASLSWTAPSTAPGNGYEWAVTTSSTPPASGTDASVTSATAAGLLSGTTYYLHVRSDCGSEFSSWVTSTAFTTAVNCATLPLLSCSTPVSSGNLAASGGTYDLTECYFGGTPGKEKLYRFIPSVTGLHQLEVTSVGSSDVYIHYFYKDGTSGDCGATGWTCIDDLATADIVEIGTLTAGTTYYILLDGEETSGTANHTFQILCPPSNDDPSMPIALTVGAGCTGAPYSNVSATLGASEPYPACSGDAVTPVWFSFVAPASGAVRVTTDLGSGTLDDTKVAIFDNSLNIVSCDDDGGSSVKPLLSTAYAIGLTPGATYKIAVDMYDNLTAQGSFCVAVDQLASSMIPTNGSCATNYQSVVGSNPDYTGWVSLLNNNSRLVALVRNPAGGNASDFSVSHYVHTGATRQAGQYYLNRNYLINNSAGATNVDVVLPFLTTEMTSLTASDPLSTISSVGVTRVEGSTCTNNFSAGTTHFYPQTANGSVGGVSWIQFQTEGFSNFFINRLTALPLELASFTGKTRDVSNMLEWETMTEKNVQWHIVESSPDGINWKETGRKPGQLDSQSPLKYQLEDRTPPAKAYYRLRSVDLDGQQNLSNTIVLSRKTDHFGITAAFPSPAKDRITVQFSSLTDGNVSVRLTDVTGRVLREQNFAAVNGINEVSLQINDFQSGIYLVTILNAMQNSNSVRIVKE